MRCRVERPHKKCAVDSCADALAYPLASEYSYPYPYLGTRVEEGRVMSCVMYPVKNTRVLVLLYTYTLARGC